MIVSLLAFFEVFLAFVALCEIGNEREKCQGNYFPKVNSWIESLSGLDQDWSE